jgi:hypothetical protein
MPVVVGFTLLLAGATTNLPKSRYSKLDASVPRVAYDTSKGTSKSLGLGDAVIKAPKEESFYIMQQLCIMGEPVLTFFDTGSNAKNLANGAFCRASRIPGTR